MRHIIDLSDLTMDEFNELYKLTSNIIDRPEGYTDACRGKVLGSLFYEPSTITPASPTAGGSKARSTSRRT